MHTALLPGKRKGIINNLQQSLQELKNQSQNHWFMQVVFENEQIIYKKNKIKIKINISLIPTLITNLRKLKTK